VGGSLRVESSEGRGTTVVLTLPVRPPAARETAPDEHEQTPAAGS